MIDFNALLNELVDQVTAPLKVRIAALEAQTESLIKTPDEINFKSLAFGAAVCNVIDNYDFGRRFEAMVDASYAVGRTLACLVDEAVDKHEREYDHDEFILQTDLGSTLRNQIGDGDIELVVKVN